MDGIRYKLKNIEETEAAKKLLQEKRLTGRPKSEFSIPSSYSADYFQRGKDYAEKLRKGLNPFFSFPFVSLCVWIVVLIKYELNVTQNILSYTKIEDLKRMVKELNRLLVLIVIMLIQGKADKLQLIKSCWKDFARESVTV